MLNRSIRPNAVFYGICYFLMLFIAVFPVSAQEMTISKQSIQAKVIKVGFPEAPNFSETDENGKHTGLVVDYLNEISKYTNWEYEYITGDSDEIFVMLKDGELDLIGGMYYNASMDEIYDYPKYNMGYNYGVLFARKDDQSVRERDITSLQGKTIGVYSRAEEKISRLEQYLNYNKVECEFVYFDYDELVDGELYYYLENGMVDLLMGNELEANGTFRVVAEFQAQPYYFATTQGNTEVLEGLNFALSQIYDCMPDFIDKNYTERLATDSMQISYTQEELDYISNSQEIKVAVVRQVHPFNCVEDKDEHDGIVPDLLKEITKETGLSFTYTYTDTYEEMLQLVKEGKADISGFYYDNEELANEQGLVLTVPYTSFNNVIAKNKAISFPEEGLTSVILSGRKLPETIPVQDVLYCNDMEEGLKAVNEGKADFMYGLSACLEQELQTQRFVNVSIFSLNESNSQISFALSRPADIQLLKILNKAIANLSSEQKENIVNRNVISIANIPLNIQTLLYTNPEQVIGILVLFLLLIIAIIVLIAHSKIRKAKMAEELQRAEAASEAKSAFLSKMSHEIRTPMNAIIGLTDLAVLSGEAPKRIQEYLDKIHSSSHYLLSIINDILDMSRIENGKLILVPEPFDMSRMLDEIHSMIQAQAQQKQLTCHFDIKIQHNSFIADSIHLKQVLVNLLSNAVKFTPDGGNIELMLQEHSCNNEISHLRFLVRDNGIGIAPEYQAKIFDAFEQTGTAKSKSAGTGLGLAISRNIVEQMGGTISVKSTVNKGTEFTIDLDIKLCTETDTLTPEPTIQNTDNTLTGIHVLLVEDNSLNAEIATELLTTQGAFVDLANDGQEAVKQFIESSCDYYQLILMDIQMPVKNGLEATKEIRSSNHPNAKSIPIVAMTANSFQEDVDAAKIAGMNGFIPKPIDIQYLFEVLKDLLESNVIRKSHF